MSKNEGKFELLGRWINAQGETIEPGTLLTLEVGDDGLPTSDLLRHRVRRLGTELEAGTGSPQGSTDEAKGRAAKIVEAAEAKAAKIVEAAEAKAAKIVEAGEAKAKKMTDDATAEVTKMLTAATQKT